MAARRAGGAPGCGRDQSIVTNQNRLREVRPVPPTALTLWGGSGLVTAVLSRLRQRTSESSLRKEQDSSFWMHLLEAMCLKFTVCLFFLGRERTSFSLLQLSWRINRARTSSQVTKGTGEEVPGNGVLREDGFQVSGRQIPQGPCWMGSWYIRCAVGPETAFLTGSQVRPLLLVRKPHLDGHGHGL